MFDLQLNLGLTRGILVILAEKVTSSTPVPEQVASCCFRCSHDPVERIIFLDFRGSGMQNKGGQNAVSTVAPSLFDISSAVRDVG